MTPQLKSITVADFRSIRGAITVPLDAPVVLIHGQNGAGKTSLLSAIELGLTGHIPSLSRFDPDYAQHLIHKDVDQSRIKLTATSSAQAQNTSDIVVTAAGIFGTGLLSPNEARFYSERCFLAQATLGRLLELYENKDASKTDSPLTRFVKDLLGLDRLDALIEGLHDAGDVRRLRTAVPDYWEVRDRIPEIDAQVGRQRSELAELDKQIAGLTQHIADLLPVLGLEMPAGSPVALMRDLKTNLEEDELQLLARRRRDVRALSEQWRTAQSPIPAEERSAFEQAAAAAELTLDEWRRSVGSQLETLLGDLAEFFPALPSSSATGPQHAQSVALELIRAEVQRCASVLVVDERDAKQVSTFDEDLGRLRARAVVITQQMASQAAEAGGKAHALNEILSSITSELCPVCGRDFREISDKPLHAHVLDSIASLTESAGRMRALSREAASTTAAIAAAERDRSKLVGRLLEPAIRDQLKTRHARLEELRRSMEALSESSAEGQRLVTRASAATRELADLRGRDQRASSVREAVQRHAVAIAVEPLQTAESIDSALARIEAHVLEQEARLVARQASRRQALAFARELEPPTRKRSAIADEIRQAEQTVLALRKSKDVADALIRDAKELARRSRDVRTRIVRRVFNDALNTVWRDLFVRLAPEEPFVPAFALPEHDGGPVEAILETRYRSGGNGGNPRAMLSAGNLNTAALTLFLALHLSVAPQMPWLVIDDPIQSMDEVHVAQFAALLRTLSKGLGRQILVAVHEKPLFDYLSLELSPAFRDDRLITIELGRNATGETVMNYEPVIWQPDTAIPA